MNNKHKQELLSVLEKIEDPKVMDAFLVDLLTPAEYEDIVLRWQIVQQLNGGIPQRRIAKSLGLSIAKVTRGSRVLLGKKGGFNQILKNKK
jgi:TrpR family trp operon transcriptional repressor